jgi:hypothetical protein
MSTTPIDLTHAATHVDVTPGGEIVLRGALTSMLDGSTIDAATTSWPKDAPGGASIDAGGLIDFAGGGFHITARDATTHEVHTIATGEAAPVCAAMGVEAPCLPLRTLAQARSRLMTMNEWASSLTGRVSVEIIAPPVYAPAVSAAPYLGVAGAVAAAIVGVRLALSIRRRNARSPRGKLLALARQVEAKLARVDAGIAAPLAPAVAATLARVKSRKVDPASSEGARVAAALARVEARLDETIASARAEDEALVATELVREMESALEAAEEVRQLPGPS